MYTNRSIDRNDGRNGHEQRANEVMGSAMARWIDRLIVVSLFLFAAFASHSIAATQTAWALGMLLWLARFTCYPRPRLSRTTVDYALFGFFLLSGISAFASYEPLVSIGKLRAASLFTIVYLFAENIPSRRVLRLLVLTLVVSCMVNVLYTIGERIVGRGVKVQGVSAASPLASAALNARQKSHSVPITDGDTLLQVDGRPLRDTIDLISTLGSLEHTSALIKIYRTEWVATLAVPRGRLLPGDTPEAQLGISSWSRGRDWRASGFYGHYITYAEALQLIMALAVGLFVSSPSKRSWPAALIGLTIAGMIVALLLTVTRASWVGFLLATALIVFLGSGRRMLFIIGGLAVPLVLAGLFLLGEKRKVSFFDRRDDSTVWRETVWRQGFQLLVSKPRHLLVGVGMDSIKGHWREWGLFDNGRMPLGHMHSNLLQLGLERGLPALMVWLTLLVLYGRTLWGLLRRAPGNHAPAASAHDRKQGKHRGGAIENGDNEGRWVEQGLVLGALGGLAGFFVSGLVHYNWGDSEVVMIFYFIMGLSLGLAKLINQTKPQSKTT